MVKGDVIAVDIGGTNLRVGVVNGKRMLDLRKVKTPESKKDFLKKLYGLIEGFMDKRIRGIGVGAPGPLRDGKILNPPSLPLKNFDLHRTLKKKFKKRVKVENDAKCVALAELKYGVGRGRKNFFVLTLGTGVGGGIVLNGKLFQALDIGGELGFIVLDRGKTFEDLVGKHGAGRLRDKELSKYLGQGIGSLINVFNPEIVVLAGGGVYRVGAMMNEVRREVGKYVILPGKFKIDVSKLKEPGLVGAGSLLD